MSTADKDTKRVPPQSGYRVNGCAKAENLDGQNHDEVLALLRQDLLEPAQTLVTLAATLIHEAKDRPEDLRNDLCRMHQAGCRLLGFAKQAVNVRQSSDPGPQFEGAFRKLRHDLGNELNQVSGFCQLLMQREQAEYFGHFLADLTRLRELCSECEQKLLSDGKSQTAIPRVVGNLGSGSYGKPDRLPVVRGDLLIVDDNPDGREMLRRLLEPKGHRIREAENGLRAIELMREQPADLVLADILMPGMDGFQLIRHLKGDPTTAQVSIIVTTGLEDSESAVQCIELGAEDYLNKPIDQRLLHARVNAALQKRLLRQRELEQFFPAEVARQLVRKPDLLQEGREAQVSVLFCDIRGFSRIAETLGPRKTVEWLSAVMEALSECVLRYQGVLVDLVGDELMAMWGAPTDQEEHAALACRAALDMLAVAPLLNQTWKTFIGEPVTFSIGVDTGPAHVGNTGTRRKFKYGPLGKTVNLASRIQRATKFLKTSLLITGNTQKQLNDSFCVRRLALVQSATLQDGLDIYELAPAGQPHWDDIKGGYEKALELFEANDLTHAAEVLGSVIMLYGAHGPELALMARTMDCLLAPDRWQKVWDLPGR